MKHSISPAGRFWRVDHNDPSKAGRGMTMIQGRISAAMVAALALVLAGCEAGSTKSSGANAGTGQNQNCMRPEVDINECLREWGEKSAQTRKLPRVGPTEKPALQADTDTPASGAVAKTPTVTLGLQSRYHPESPGFGTLGQRFSEEIKRNTNNQLAFDFHGPAGVVQPRFLFDAIGRGTVDAGWSSPPFSARYEPALWLFTGYPFGPSAEQHWRWMQQGGGQIILDDIYEKHGVKGVPCGYLGQSGFGWFQQPVASVNDLKTMKMYMSYSSILGQKVMRKLGVEIQHLWGAEVTPAFKHGLVDGVSLNTPAHDIIFELHKFGKHYYYPGWQKPFMMIELIINKQKWEMLTDKQRHAVEDTCRQNIEFALSDGAAETKKALRVIKAQGVIVRELPAPILRELRLAWNEVIKEESKQSIYFEKTLQSIESATATQSPSR